MTDKRKHEKEDYLKAMYLLKRRKDQVTRSDLERYFEASANKVNRVVDSLLEEGYLYRDAAFQKPLKIVSKDGKLTVCADLIPLTTSLGKASFTGYLSEFYYYADYEGGDSGYDMPEDETPVAATVLSYYEGIYDSYNDAKTGTDASVKGRLYPKSISFPITEKDPELWVQVYVPVMEAISPGGGRQYAKLELDWSTLKKVSDSTQDSSDSKADDTENNTENKNNTTKTVDKKALHHMLLTAASLASRTSVYTGDSISALKAAMKKAQKVYDNDSATAAQVEKQVAALSAAILNLEEKTDGKLDINELQDGTYYLYGKMLKTDKKNASMSNEAIDHTITLKVKNGKYYLNMKFHGLTINSRKGYLSRLKYFTNTYTLNSYGVPKGAVKAVSVKSYQKSGGKVLSDSFGTNYPAQVEFPMIEKAKSDGYVPLQVFVPIMEALSSGSGTQPVYLKLDLSSLTADKNNVSGSDSPNSSQTSGETTANQTTPQQTTTTGTVGAGTIKNGSTLPQTTTGTGTAAGTRTTTGTGTAVGGTTAGTGTAAGRTAAGNRTTGIETTAGAGNTAGTGTGSSYDQAGLSENTQINMGTGTALTSSLETMNLDGNTGQEEMTADADSLDESYDTNVSDEEGYWVETEESSPASAADIIPSVTSVLAAVAGVLYKVKSRM